MGQITRELRALIKSEIEDLITEYGYLFDHGEAARMADLFTDDGIFEGVAGKATGREQLEKIFMMAAGRVSATRHVSTNVRLVIESENEAAGSVVVTSYMHMGQGMGKPQAHLVGDFVDRYRRGEDGKWRFAERKVVKAFSLY